jgi:hypothetical protein
MLKERVDRLQAHEKELSVTTDDGGPEDAEQDFQTRQSRADNDVHFLEDVLRAGFVRLW